MKKPEVSTTVVDFVIWGSLAVIVKMHYFGISSQLLDTKQLNKAGKYLLIL